MNTITKKSGFKNYNDTFWVNERGKYGCRYQCKHCGKTSLGIGNDRSMHYSSCPRHPDSASKRRYLVVSMITISVHTEVEAASEAEAATLAMERPVMRLCNQCATGEPDREWVTSGELDGEPDGECTITPMDDES